MEILKCSTFNIFILVLYLSFFSATDCLEIKKDNHQSAGDDSDDWRKNAFTTQNPLDLDPGDLKTITFQSGDLDWWKKIFTTREQGDDIDDSKKNAFTTQNPPDSDPLNLERITFDPVDDPYWWKKLLTTREQGDDRRKKIFSTRKPSEWCKYDFRTFTLYPGEDTKHLELYWKEILNCDPSSFTRSDLKTLPSWFTTRDPLDWNRNRWDFKIITLAPRDDFNYLFKENSKSGIYIGAGLGIFFLCILVLASMKYYHNESGNDSLYGRVATNNSRRNSATSVSPLSTVSRTLTSDRPHLVIEFTNETDSNIGRNFLDRPPKYDDVVTGDLSGSGTFPEVTTSIPETPPPEYNEGTTRY